MYSEPVSSLEVPLAKSLRVVGTVALSSARSTTERVVFCPAQRRLHSETKSSTMFLPISMVGMEVFWESLVSQLV